jgi:hypothetical protein
MTVFYKEFVLGQHPLYIKNSITNWHALDLWTSDEYLVRAAGDEQVHVQQDLHSRFGFADESAVAIKTGNIPLKDFLQLYKTHDVNHIYRMSGDLLPSLELDYKIPDYVPCLNDKKAPYYTHFGISMGYGGESTPILNEPDDSLLMVIDGYKRVLLYPPQQGDMLYEDRTTASRTSAVSIANPDYTIHPLFQYVTPHEVILYPGDVLYIPAYWFHHIESSCRNLAVDIFFDIHNSVHVLEGLRKEKKELLPKSADMVELQMGQPSQCVVANQIRNAVTVVQEIERKDDVKRGD